MPVGNIAVPNIIYPISGIKIGVTAAGVRYEDRDDLTIFVIDKDANTQIVTTQNAFCAAPVTIAKNHIKQENPRYLLINTGNANAGTGSEGYDHAIETCQALANKSNLITEQVLPFSTGVIGEPLNSQAIIAGLDDALQDISENNWERAANAIMTTDTVPKVASAKLTVEGQDYHITGISKGAGMIRPNMATMLGFIATDANISSELLHDMLVELVNGSFNRITVDGDTSTNDCCTLIATAKTNTVIDSKSHPHYVPLFDALKSIFVRLATLIVRDGEGASKFITVKVSGGIDSQECCKVAYAVAHSPLVKTAFFASDPNWGRILAAVGYAGLENLDTSQIDVHLDEVNICQRGQVAGDYTEEAGQIVMNRPEICIHIELGRGDASDTVYTCDLSYDYVRINGDYRS